MPTKKTDNCILVDYDNLSPNTLRIEASNLSQMSLEYENVNCCPICHTSIFPEVQASVAFNAFSNEYSPQVVLINKCPKCNSSFVVVYNTNFDTYNYRVEAKSENIVFVAPSNFTPVTFSSYLYGISNRFAKVYNQALQAETLELDEISDMGFRKALEILVKDYAISMFSNDSDKIIKMPLSNCIKTYIIDSRIQNLAEKAAWIGNDKSHYATFFADYDVPSIKNLIEAIIYFIGLESVVEKARAIPHKSNLKTP